MDAITLPEAPDTLLKGNLGAGVAAVVDKVRDNSTSPS